MKQTLLYAIMPGNQYNLMAYDNQGKWAAECKLWLPVLEVHDQLLPVVVFDTLLHLMIYIQQ